MSFIIFITTQMITLLHIIWFWLSRPIKWLHQIRIPTYFGRVCRWFSLSSSTLSLVRRPKFAGRKSSNVSFRYNSVRFIRWVKPSGSLQKYTDSYNKIYNSIYIVYTSKLDQPYITHLYFIHCISSYILRCKLS